MPCDIGSRGGTPIHVTKLRAHAMLFAIIGGLAMLFFVTRYFKPERVKRGTPEFDAYIEHYVRECISAPDRYKLLPTLTGAELEAACRNAVLEADRFNPSARPLK